MKKILFLLFGLVAFYALADGPIVQTTPFTRNVLRATSSADAQTRLGFSGTTTLTVISNTAVAAVLPIPQTLYVFVGDSRLSQNAVVGTNVWPWLFAAGHESCGVSNYAVPGITASNIWVGWSTNGGTLGNPGRPYTALVAAGVNDLAQSLGTAGVSSNSAFIGLTNIWHWERTNGAKVVAFTVAPNFNDMADNNYFLNWTNLNQLILAASNDWDFCIDEGHYLNIGDTGDGLHQNPQGVVKETGFVNATLKGLSGFYYPNGSFINVNGPFFPTAIVTNGAGYFAATPVGGSSYNPLSVGVYQPGLSSLYSYQGVATIRTSGGGFALANNAGSLTTLTLDESGDLTAPGRVSCGPLFSGGPGGSFSGVSIGQSIANTNSLYTYANVATWRDAGSGWSLANGIINSVLISDAGAMTVAGSLLVSNSITANGSLLVSNSITAAGSMLASNTVTGITGFASQGTAGIPWGIGGLTNTLPVELRVFGVSANSAGLMFTNFSSHIGFSIPNTIAGEYFVLQPNEALISPQHVFVCYTNYAW